MTEQTPAQLGFHMPAEWEPHAATWLAWPHKEASWPGKLHTVPPVYAQMVRALMEGEKVCINVCNEVMRTQAESILREHGAWGSNVELHIFPTNDAWVRDHGPIFVVRDRKGKREVAATDWKFNMWGGKYPPFDLDNEIPRLVCDHLGVQRFEIDIVMEGGSIDVNGKGTLLTTEACLLNKNRNPHLSAGQIQKYLCDNLGVRHILWLGDGIEGDDTDGHVDDLSRFVNATTIVTVIEPNKQDPNHLILKENYELLQSMTDQDNKRLNVVTLPMPVPVEFEGQRLPASYANFYIGNACVLVPAYNCPADETARGILQEFFPDRKAISIDCSNLVWGLGAFHCVSQQQPAAIS